MKESLLKGPFNMPSLKRYVDDLILALPVDGMSIFSSNNEHILVRICERKQENNNLITEWYRKLMCINSFISYHSQHSPRMKIAQVVK